MKIKRLNELNENNDEKSKFYVYQIHPGDTTYRGSIWDSPQKPWVPDSAKLIGEFEVGRGWRYMTVSQDDLDEINEIKLKTKIDKETKKYNL